MTEHIHRCLSCTPDMVPDFDRADPRYHDGEKCGSLVRASLDGVEMAYTSGIFEGQEGWLLFAGAAVETVHTCTCPERNTCVELRFGKVDVAHQCPERVVAQLLRMREALRPFAHDVRAWNALHGEDR